jgi:heat shock protein HslJ
MRHRFLALCCVALVGTLLLPGCRGSVASVKDAANNPGGHLENTDWALDRYADRAGSTAKVIPGSNMISIHFEGGRITGFSGCNDFSGAFSVYKSQLTINNVSATNMACPAKIMSQENAFLYYDLQNAAKFRLEGDKLTIFDNKNRTLAAFTRYTPPTVSGTVWRVTAYANANGNMVQLIAGTKISAEFSPDGAINGFAGCNQYTGKWNPSLAHGNISVGGLTAGKKKCASPAGVMQQERDYLRALRTAATYTMTSSEMTFETASGSTAVKLSAVR